MLLINYSSIKFYKKLRIYQLVFISPLYSSNPWICHTEHAEFQYIACNINDL